MPPEGYDTVTLPVELIDQLDALNNTSRSATVEMLLSEYDDGPAESLTDGLADDEVAVVGTREALVEELAARLSDAGVGTGGDSDVRADLREQLDRIESAATTAEARTGRIEGTLEDMGAGR
jgi:hypothetical protein